MHSPWETSLPLSDREILKLLSFAFPLEPRSQILMWTGPEANRLPSLLWRFLLLLRPCLQTCRRVDFPHFSLTWPANPKLSTMVTPTHLCYLCFHYPQCKRFSKIILFTHCLTECIPGNFEACTFPWSCSNIKSNILLANGPDPTAF